VKGHGSTPNINKKTTSETDPYTYKNLIYVSAGISNRKEKIKYEVNVAETTEQAFSKSKRSRFSNPLPTPLQNKS
jgi:hypothetical protein